MGTNSSILDFLFRLGKVMVKGLGGKVTTISYNTMIPAEIVMLLLGLKSLMAVQTGLESHVHLP